MIKSKFSRYMMRSLKRGKKAKLCLSEMFILAVSGYKDGKCGLPKVDAAGEWTSPKIQKERNACCESQRKIYGTLQIRLEKEYRRANQLADKLEVYERRLNELKMQQQERPAEEELRRRRGEEALSDMQVQRRRQREYERMREKYNVAEAELREKLETDLEELIEVKSYLFQMNREADLVSDRIMSHTQQRIDFYWDAAMHADPKVCQEMPVTYRSLPIPEVTAEHRSVHEKEERRIADIIDRFKLQKEAV